MVNIHSLNSTEFTKFMLGQDSPISIDSYIRFTDEISGIEDVGDLTLHTKEFVSNLGLENYFLIPVSKNMVKCFSQGGLEAELVNDHNLQQVVEESAAGGVISQLQGGGSYSGQGLFGEKIRSKDDFFALHGIVHSRDANLRGVTEKLQLINRMISGKFKDNFTKLLDPKIPIIFNGVYFDKQVDEALTKAYAENQSISILLGDFCALKYCNDMFGHSVGDLMLQRSAEMLLDKMPKNSIVSRFGSKSDEFGVLLYGVDNDKANEYRGEVEMALKEKNESRPFIFKSIEKNSLGQNLVFPFYLPMGVVTINPRDSPNIARREIYEEAEKQYTQLKTEFYKVNPHLNLRDKK